MAGDNGSSQRRAPDVKAPLALSAILGGVAFLIASVVGSGGTEGGLRFDLGLIIGGIAFIVSVVVSATLMMLDKPNDPSLGQGTGVNRSSAKLYAQRRGARTAGQPAAGSGEGAGKGSASAPRTGTSAPDPRDDDGGPQFGQRVHPEQ